MKDELAELMLIRTHWALLHLLRPGAWAGVLGLEKAGQMRYWVVLAMGIRKTHFSPPVNMPVSHLLKTATSQPSLDSTRHVNVMERTILKIGLGPRSC